MEEIWKPVYQSCGDYQVSNLGRFKSLLWKNDRLLKVYPSLGGTPTVRIYNQPVSAIHIVANAFLPYPGNGDFTPVPKNNDPTDIRADNLEWIPGKLNVFQYCMDRKMAALESLIKKEMPDD